MILHVLLFLYTAHICLYIFEYVYISKLHGTRIYVCTYTNNFINERLSQLNMAPLLPLLLGALTQQET